MFHTHNTVTFCTVCSLDFLTCQKVVSLQIDCGEFSADSSFSLTFLDDDDCSITVISKASISLNVNRPQQEEELHNWIWKASFGTEEILCSFYCSFTTSQIMLLHFIWMMMLTFHTGKYSGHQSTCNKRW